VRPSANFCLFRLARKIVAKRFGPNKIVQKDMLGSFIKNGLSQEEAQVEILTQMSVHTLPFAT
jgi:hypothetical protein